MNPGKTKRACEFVDGATSRDNVIDKQNMLVVNRFRRRKGISYILSAFFGKQIRLGRGCAKAFAGGCIKLDPELSG